MTRFFTTASLIAVSFAAAQTADAAEIFNEDFFGENPFVGPLPSNHNAPSTGGGLPGGRRGGSGDFFVDYMLFEGANFGGIDQVGSNGDPGFFANDGATKTVTIFSTPGNTTGPVLPSGAFSQTFTAGEVINYSFDVFTNGSGAPGDSTYELLISFDNGSSFETLASGTIPDNTGTNQLTPITGSYNVTSAASSFIVQAQLVNPATGNDQIQMDNIVLDLVPEPSSLALLGLGGLLIARRRRG